METLTLPRPTTSLTDDARALTPDELLDWAWSIRADPSWFDEDDDSDLLVEIA